MLKRSILALLLVLCLALPLIASAASPVLPDLAAFAGDLIDSSKVEDFDFALRVTCYSSKENVRQVALAYVDLLLEKYDICKHAHFTSTYTNNQAMVRYALGYTGTAAVGTVGYSNDDEGWQISAASVIVYYTQFNADNFVQITYRREFDYKDMGDRADGAAAVPTATAKAAPKSTATVKATPKATAGTVSCTNCGGDGKVSRSCSSCGGDGDIERRCANCGGDGERDCLSCHGKGYDDCSGCSGDGERRCGRCNGTGEDWKDDRCNTCGGDGEVKCSSCSGSGNKRCTACSGSGDRRCSSCSGRGTTESRCSSCSGDGRRESTCSTCQGTGVVK